MFSYERASERWFIRSLFFIPVELEKQHTRTKQKRIDTETNC